MPKLQIADEKEQYVYEIFDEEVSLGRGAANAIQVADTHASKHHAVLRHIRGHWKLIDLESSNGTKVNGEFRNQHWLSNGDEVSIGLSVLRFDADGAAEGPPEVADAPPMTPRGVAPRAVPARPAAVPARPAVVPGKAVAVPPKPVVPPAPVAAAPAVLEEAPVEIEAQVTPVSPARSRGARPAARRSRTRDRYDDDDYADGEDRPRREPRKNNSAMVGLGIGAGCIVFVLLIFLVFDQSNSHNKDVLYEGMRLARQGKHADAVAYAEREGRADELDYEKLQTGMQSWKIRVAAGKSVLRNTEAQRLWKETIQYKAYSERRNKDGSIGNTTRPIGALADDEIVIRIRQFLKDNWDTMIVRTFLGSEYDVFPYFRDLLRQHADESYTAGKAWAEIQDDVQNFKTRRHWGKAVRRLKVHGQTCRLTLLGEAWQKLQAQINNEARSIEEQAADELVDELQAVRDLVTAEERDTATQQVRILVDRFNGIPSLSEQIRELRDRLQLKE